MKGARRKANREIKFRALKENPKEYVGGWNGDNQDNAKWVYGSGIVPVYINTYLNQDMLEMVVDVNYDELDYWKPDYSTSKILPNTVCQFTGLRDTTTWEELIKEEQKKFLSNINPETGRRNTQSDWKGIEIYEGDIISFTHEKHIKIEDELCSKKRMKKYKRNYAIEFINTPYTYGLRARNKSIHFPLKQSTINTHDGKIIGNVFENSDLLKEE